LNFFFPLEGALASWKKKIEELWRRTRRTRKKIEGLPRTHCSLRFFTSLRMVYCRINKLNTDTGSRWNSDTRTLKLDSGHSTVINFNRYGSTYRMES
jgi:hypothetical protein